MIRRITKFLHYLFIPGDHNNFRAKVLHHDSLTAYLIAIILFVFFTRSAGPSGGSVLGIATDISIQKLFEYTNQQRQLNGLAPLTYNQKLAKAAQLKAKDMFAKNYWAHFAPDGTSTPWEFILQSGYQYDVAGENLAKNFLYSQNVVTAWMNSPTHRENLLRPDFTDVGFAVVNGQLSGEETTLVVQMFGKPLVTAAKQRQAIIQQAPGNEVVLAESSKRSLISLPFTSSQLVSAFIIFLIAVFFVDLYFAARFKLIRVQGKSIAHIIFLITIIIGVVFILSNGSIL